jgi:type I restriction enzyme S subunit
MREVNLVNILSVAKIVSGSTPKGIDKFDENQGKIPFFRVADMNTTGNEIWMDLSKINVSEPSSIHLKLKICDRGTVIFPKRGGAIFTNKKRRLSRTSAFDLNTMGLCPNEKVNSDYFYYWFNSLDLGQLANGSSVPQLNNNQISPLQIPLPPLDHQKKIAAILDAADAYRQKTKALITKYEELTQSLFLDMFGDPFTNSKKFPIRKIGELCDELFLGLTSKVDYVEEGGFPLIRAKDINKGVLSFEKVKFISEIQHKKLTARRVTQKGDVLISKSGTLGTCAIVNSDKKFSTYESIFTVRPKPEVLNNLFLVFLVRNKGFQIKLLGNKVGGTVAHLNLKMFRDFEFPLPPVLMQKEFTQKAQTMETQKTQAQGSLIQAEDLFNSLLQKAFKGELS